MTKEVMAKIREYFCYGVRRVWIVRPLDRQIYVYSSPTQVMILDPDDELRDEELLPGFRLPVAPLFNRTAT